MELEVAIDAFARVLPVLLLVGLGALFRRTGFLSGPAIDGLRKLVLNVTLPAALFLAFLRTELEAQYAVIVISVFGACLVMLAAGPGCGEVSASRARPCPASWPGSRPA